MKLFVFPGNINQKTLDIAARQIPYVRTTEFSDLMLQNESMLKQLMGLDNGHVLFYTASGTGAMDALVSNLVTTYEKILVVRGGTFGNRWKELCAYYNVATIDHAVPFGRDLDYGKLEGVLAKETCDLVLIQHHETSSGQLFDMLRVGEICRRLGTALFVDAIGSVLTDWFDMSSCSVDAAVLSSQKGLALPAGASFVVLGERVIGRGFNRKGFYLDFVKSLSDIERGQTPFTPAAQIFVQLHNRLRDVLDSTAERTIAGVANKASHFRRLLASGGYEFSAECPSNCLTGFYVTGSASDLVQALSKQEIFVMPSCRPNLIRVAHTGDLRLEAYDELYDAVEKWKRGG